MSNKVDIFGVKFDNLTTGQIAARLFDAITVRKESGGLNAPLVVFTPNPEIVMSARQDKDLLEALCAADIICPDGVGIVWASKFFGEKIKERASGIDVVTSLFEMSANGEIRAFFFGGSEDSVTKAAVKMREKYKGLTVCGTHNGYFKDDAHIIDDINESGASLLLVGLGSPKQEMWVYKNASKLRAAVIVVVGGSFDVMSGNLKRAPLVFRKVGLEWFYRLMCQPKRIFRMIKLPQFVLKVYITAFGLSRRKQK